MCNHRAVSRWHKFWNWFTAVFLLGFLAPEVYGLYTVGPEASWSAWWWHRLGTLERCRHTRAGRAGIFTFCVWLWAHLSYGKFGFGGRRAHRHNQEVPS